VRSWLQVWADVSHACGHGMPCFVGTHGGPAGEKLYAVLEKERSLKLFSNHCYKLVACATDAASGERCARTPGPLFGCAFVMFSPPLSCAVEVTSAEAGELSKRA